MEPVDRGTATSDGRLVAFRRFGAVPGQGVPTVLYCHGGLSCGADAALGHAAALDRGVSILAVDRPGIGGSDPAPRRTTGSFAADAGAVLDHLGIERVVGAVGWSLGGQYAMACGALLADRVGALAVVGGVPPLSWPGVRRELSATDRALLGAVGNWVPPSWSRRVFGAVGRRARRTADARGDGPTELGRALRRTWGPADAAVLAAPAGSIVDAAVAEATSSADAMREEYLAWVRDWGFEPSQVAVPTTVWQGDADRWVSTALAGRLAAAVPDAQLRVIAGAGHLLLAQRWGDVLDDLVD